MKANNPFRANRKRSTSPTKGYDMHQSPPIHRGKGEWVPASFHPTRLDPYRPKAIWHPKSRGEFGVNDYERGGN